MCRSLRIEGSATPTIDTSRASRKIAPQSTRSVPQARLLRRSTRLSGDGCDIDLDTSTPFGRAGELAGFAVSAIVRSEPYNNVRYPSNNPGRATGPRPPPSRSVGDRSALALARAQRPD